ncbi:ATP phosphoribosyltransferase regulatory subunit [Pikeienuella piscinae]|uniref:ATP phosphoribosyltransferase regulatory subunit n=1 Tax=Pikeienuella piscinae TaxID=2748098 RepID=A0A7M3T5P4_9RHOB|nr:ATP phosphoribosyltransferase regulatory subunit [Pikeienuella piscinae]QIE57325.1 ATP phosphoribosyltransferase regulatory subunit [Pikeienuella piscinae]
MAAARAYLTGGRIGADLDRLSALRARIMARLTGAGAARVEPETLQPADLLLDLYGEDIRARAYIVEDPSAGELALRPDFTVPVARLHMAGGADPARYAYEGLVWRRQPPGSDRPSEYLQAGIELIGGADPAAEEAEVFALIAAALEGAEAAPLTGDLGVVFAAIAAMETTEPRRAALRRHVWRPARFHALLERYADPPAPSPTRAALLGADRAGRIDAIAAAGRIIGARGEAEILERLDALTEDAATPPLEAGEKAMIEAVLAVKGRSDEALARLRAMARAPMHPALDRMERRLDALADLGVDAGALPFDAAFGRGLEYYDGFVFEFRSARAGLPPLGGGGRYDALTAILGGGAGAPAVGGIVRPEALLAAGAAA